MCDQLLSDETLLSKMRENNFDLVMIDVFYITECYYIIPYKLDVPFVGFTTVYDPWQFRVPAIPSFSPFILGEPFTEDMSVWQVIQNIFTLIQYNLRPGIHSQNDALIEK